MRDSPGPVTVLLFFMLKLFDSDGYCIAVVVGRDATLRLMLKIGGEKNGLFDFQKFQ